MTKYKTIKRPKNGWASKDVSTWDYLPIIVGTALVVIHALNGFSFIF